LAVAIRPTDIRRHDSPAAARVVRAHDPLRTECLTPLAVTLGLVMWGVIILVVRALV
jgi:hypothetical protein